MAGHFEPGLARRAVGKLPMPAAYFNLVLRMYGRSRSATERLLHGTGISEADARTLAPDEPIRLWQAIQQVRNLGFEHADWGLELGRMLQNAAHGTLGVAAASAPTLAEALSTLERFAYLRAPYFRLTGGATRSVFRLRVEEQIEVEPDVWRGLVEALLLSLQALIESALGQPMREGRFDVDYAAPPYADRYGSAFHAPVSFARAESAIAIPKSWLPLPCPFADRPQHRLAIERLELAERGLQGPQLIAAQVERVLEGAGPAIPALDDVAAQLRLSRRTLVRRLESRGHSFRELAERVRKRRASSLLADPSLSVSEVAYRLGYSDQANFGRAFRRWFGASPRRYRERLRRSTRRRAG